MDYQPQPDYAGTAPQPPYPVPTSISNERKGSIAVSNRGFVSPTHENWHDLPIDAKHVAEGMNDLALGPTAGMDAPHFKTEQGWSPPQGYNQSGDFGPLMADYGGNPNANGMGMQYDPSQTGPPSAGSMSAMPAMPNQDQFSMSPQSQTWLPTPVGESFEFSPLAPQGNRQTPVFATSTNIMRRDGIRKKNARFDIPAERNLRTIDQLIAQTVDESEIKELKQQKRLLRNRQAALDSRQRKKQHTERLEEEKKHYTSMITDLEEEHKQLEAQWLQRQEDWMRRQAQYTQWIQSLQNEKEQAIQHYSNEVNELRRQNSMLVQQMQKDPTNMSSSSSAGMPGEFNDFDQLTIQGSPWDNFQMQNEFSLESEHSSEHPLQGPSLKNSNTMAKKDDKNSASGLLLMLLLCGAWVVSRGSTDTKEILPAMPDDLRAASASVIQDLYKGSGINLPESDTAQGGLVPAVAQDPMRGPGSYDGAMNSYAANSMTGSHVMGQPQQETFSQPGANVQAMGDILREAMRSVQSQQAPAPTTYTKSVLADKVPNQVLKDFAQMVAQNRQAKHDSNIPSQLQQPTYD